MAEDIAPSVQQPTGNLSYKFQRLREQLRQAVIGGEFTGRLPGERELGRRFKANAKTINKALGDLSTEGLIMRQIGRGTFVVPRNGHAALEASGRCFRCLAAPLPFEEAHRCRWIEQIRDGLESKGHHLEVTSINNGEDSRHSVMSTWSSEERKRTHGLLSFPADPLSGGTGRLDEASTAEIIRRHLPIVVVGALSQTVKLHAVVPDYADAGFRLVQHLIQTGCQTIILLATAVENREVECVCTAALAACARHGTPCERIPLEQSGEYLPWLDGGPDGRSNGVRRTGGPIGLLCVGAKALQTAIAAGLLPHAHSSESMELACVLEPGNEAARQAGVTHYAVPTQRLAEWATRLLVDAKPGQPPVEIIVPGTVHVADALREQGSLRFSGRPQTQWAANHSAELAEARV